MLSITPSATLLLKICWVPNGSGNPPAPVVISIVGLSKNSLKELPCKFLGNCLLCSSIDWSAAWVAVQSFKPVIPPL